MLLCGAVRVSAAGVPSTGLRHRRFLGPSVSESMATWFAQTFLLAGLDTMIVLPLAQCNPHAGKRCFGWCSQEARKGTGAAKYGSIFCPPSTIRCENVLIALSGLSVLVGVQGALFDLSSPGPNMPRSIFTPHFALRQNKPQPLHRSPLGVRPQWTKISLLA